MESSVSDNFSTEVQTAGTGSIRGDIDEFSESTHQDDYYSSEGDDERSQYSMSKLQQYQQDSE